MNNYYRKLVSWLCIAAAFALIVIAVPVVGEANEYPVLDLNMAIRYEPSVAAFCDWWNSHGSIEKESFVTGLTWFGITDQEKRTISMKDWPAIPEGTLVVWVDKGDIWIASFRREGILWLVKPKSVRKPKEPQYGAENYDEPIVYSPAQLEAILRLYGALMMTRRQDNDGNDFSLRIRHQYSYWDMVNACDIAFKDEYRATDCVRYVNQDMEYFDPDMKYFHYVFLTATQPQDSVSDYRFEELRGVHIFTDDFFSQNEQELGRYSGQHEYEPFPNEWKQ